LSGAMPVPGLRAGRRSADNYRRNHSEYLFT
jgi:hypothetical protein